MEQFIHAAAATPRVPWNKGRLVGQKAPLKLKDIWAIRVRLQVGKRIRELALFNLAIDSKLRSCDLVKLRVRDVCHGSLIAKRAIVIQQKTQRPVQFEITEQTRESLTAWIRNVGLRSDDFLFPSRIHTSPHLSTRQYARIVRGWVREIGLDSNDYGTHTMRRTKASLIYFSVIRNWKARCATSASRSTTLWKWLSRLKCRLRADWRPLSRALTGQIETFAVPA
jgi:integrase